MATVLDYSEAIELLDAHCARLRAAKKLGRQEARWVALVPMRVPGDDGVAIGLLDSSGTLRFCGSALELGYLAKLRSENWWELL